MKLLEKWKKNEDIINLILLIIMCGISIKYDLFENHENNTAAFIVIIVLGFIVWFPYLFLKDKE